MPEPQRATHWRCCKCHNKWLYALYRNCTACNHSKCGLCKPLRYGDGGYVSNYRPKSTRPENEPQAGFAETRTDRSKTVARSIRADNPTPDDSDEADISLDTEPSPKQADDIKKRILHIAESETNTSTPTDSKLPKSSDVADPYVFVRLAPSLLEIPRAARRTMRADEGEQKHLQKAGAGTDISTRMDSQIPNASGRADICLDPGPIPDQTDGGDAKNRPNAESGTTISNRTDSQIPKGSDGADICLDSEPSSNQADNGDEKDLHNAELETTISTRTFGRIFNDSDEADVCLDFAPSSEQADNGGEIHPHDAESENMDLAGRAKLKAREGPSASNPSKTAIQPLSEENTEVHEKGNLTEKLVDTLKNPLRQALHIPGMPNPAQSMPSPGIAQLLESESSPFDENMSFEALMKLRRGAFGGSSTSINSLGGPPSSLPLAHVSAQSFAERKPAVDKWRKYMLLWTLFFRPRVQHESHLVFHTDGDAIPSSFANKLKGMVESKIKRRVMWWPLSPVHAQRDPNRTLISWECCCGAAFSIIVASQHVQDLSRQIGTITNLAVQIPILPTHQSQPSGGNPATRAAADQSRSTVPGNRPVVPQGSNNTGGNNDPSSIQPDSTSDNATIQGRDDFLHWCVDTSRTTTRLVELPTIQLSDANLVPTLLSKYKILRQMRSWLTLTTCIGVRFIKFRKLFREGDYVTHLQDELPCRRTNLEYSYQYCDSATSQRDFIRWIQAIIAVRFEYPNCPETLKLGSVFEYIPKKVQGKMQKPEGYGMYAVSAYCFWKAVVALVVASVPSIIFLIRWMIGHQGDWQNALTWLAVTYSLLNILVLQHDRWSMDTIR